MSEPSRVERLKVVAALLEGALLEGSTPVRDAAAVSREYRAVLGEIAELEPPKAEGDGIDEITERRNARRASAASRPSRTKRSS